MDHTTIGVDSSLNSVKSTNFVVDNVTANSVSGTTTFIYPEASTLPEDSGPALHPLAEPSAFPTVVQIVNGIVTPNLRVLLASVLGAIDASIPNKDQNKAVKHIVRTQFDEAYFDILRRSYPDSNFVSGPEYSVTPESNRSKAMAEGFLKQG